MRTYVKINRNEREMNKVPDNIDILFQYCLEMERIEADSDITSRENVACELDFPSSTSR
jgi:hypothetical protein